MWKRVEHCPAETWDWGDWEDAEEMYLRLTNFVEGGWVIEWRCCGVDGKPVTLKPMSTSEAKRYALRAAIHEPQEFVRAFTKELEVFQLSLVERVKL